MSLTINEIVKEAERRTLKKKEKVADSERLGETVARMLEPYLKELTKVTKEASRLNIEQIKRIKIEAPNVNVAPTKVTVPTPKVTVNVPKIEVPKAEVKVSMPKIPTPKVTVNVPEIKVPKQEAPKVTVKVPEIKIPEIKVPIDLEPKRVVLVDSKTGSDYVAKSGGGGGGGGVVSTRPLQDIPAGFEQLAIGATSTRLASIPDNANKAVLTVEDATLRYKDSGADPTATEGLKVYIGGTIFLNSRQSLTNFRAIRVGGTNSEVNVMYYENK